MDIVSLRVERSENIGSCFNCVQYWEFRIDWTEESSSSLGET